MFYLEAAGSKNAIQPRQHGSTYTPGESKGLSKNSIGTIHKETRCAVVRLD